MTRRLQWISKAAFDELLTGWHWRQVLGAFTAAIFPLFFLLPQPLGALLAVACAMKWGSVLKDRPKLALWSIALVFPAGIALVAAGLRAQGVTLSFAGLLGLMSVCKLLEARNLRDTKILFLLALCDVLAVLMYSQAMWLLPYIFLAAGWQFYALMQISQRHSLVSVMSGWCEIVKLAAAALPLVIVLFFTFPRITPLWGMQRAQTQAITGLPNEMSLGDMGRLAQSNEVSFRVSFAGSVPAGKDLYWRGPVLWNFTGEQWLQRGSDRFGQPPDLRYLPDSSVRYTIIPAKNDLDWLTPLDMPVDVPAGLRTGYTGQIRMPDRQKGDARFTLTSALQYRFNGGRLSRRDAQDALRLPADLDIPKTRELAQKLYAEGGNTVEGFAQAFMNFIRNNEYYYTLEPAPGSGDVENFLFNTHTGFCEHYASAFAISARTAGIASRIVIGYQGGELNPMTGEWVVREEAAHAWTELWIEGKGWTRYDPTAAVAPFRIETARLSGESLSGEDSRSWGSRMAEKYGTMAWLRNAGDSVQTFYRNWVVGFDGKRQNSLLGSLGLGKAGKSALFGIGALIVCVIGFILWRRRENRARTDEDVFARAARVLLKRLEKRGVAKGSRESLPAFLRRVAKDGKAHEPAAWLLAADNAESLRYRQTAPDAAALKSAAAELRTLRLR